MIQLPLLLLQRILYLHIFKTFKLFFSDLLFHGKVSSNQLIISFFQSNIENVSQTVPQQNRSLPLAAVGMGARKAKNKVKNPPIFFYVNVSLLDFFSNFFLDFITEIS